MGSSDVAVVLENGVPSQKLHVNKTQSIWQHEEKQGDGTGHTQLDFEDMGAILWFYEHDLVFVCVIEWLAGVFLDANMEHCRSNLKRTAIGGLSDKLRTAEAKLCVGSIVAGQKD